MRLLEIVRGAATAADVLATGFALARRLGKVAVVAGVCEGFIGTHFSAYRTQMEYLVEDGAWPEEVDGRSRPMASRWGRSRCSTSPGSTSPGRAQAARRHPRPARALRRHRRPPLRAGALRPQDRARLVPLSRGRQEAGARSGGARPDRGRGGGQGVRRRAVTAEEIQRRRWRP